MTRYMYIFNTVHVKVEACPEHISCPNMDTLGHFITLTSIFTVNIRECGSTLYVGMPWKHNAIQRDHPKTEVEGGGGCKGYTEHPLF